MKKFYYTLKDNPQYPEIMMANSKAEVKSLLLENIGPNNEDQILMILSEDEMKLKNDPNIGALYKDSSEYSNGNDFLNDVIKSANNELSNQKLNMEEMTIQSNQINETSFIPPIQSFESVKSNPKYFEEGGIQFKVDSGRVYKKVWKLVEDVDNFRIINATTKKPINSEKYLIEKLDWDEIN